MKKVESHHPLNEKRTRAPELCLALAILGLGATFLAHLGNHLQIHLQIADVAMSAEALGAAFSIMAISKRDKDARASVNWLRGAVASLIITSGCVVAVPLTDSQQYSEFLLSGKVLNPESWGRLATCWKNDAERELFYGVKYLGRLPTDPDPNLKVCTPADLYLP